MHFGLGSTLAFRRKDLEAIGGFESIVDYLADDYELGKRIAERGSKVVLSKCVVDTFLPGYGFSGFFSHQLRWARTIRASRPGGYGGLLFTYTLPWATLCLVLARGTTWAWALLTVAVLLRITTAWASAVSVLKDEHAMRWLWLLTLRDFLAPVVWVAGLLLVDLHVPPGPAWMMNVPPTKSEFVTFVIRVLVKFCSVLVRSKQIQCPEGRIWRASLRVKPIR